MDKLVCVARAAPTAQWCTPLSCCVPIGPLCVQVKCSIAREAKKNSEFAHCIIHIWEEKVEKEEEEEEKV